MKKIFTLVLSTILLTSAVSQSFALTSTTPTASPKTTATPSPKETTTQENQIEKIKDLVASKVAELKLVDKRGIIGTVKSTSNTEMTVIDYKNNQQQIDIDELTKFESDDSKTFGISDIKSGDALSIIGLYNKETNRLLARFVSRATNIPMNIDADIVSKDASEFTLNVVTNDGKQYTIDVQTSTKSSTYNQGEMTKSGFSKIETGKRAIIVGFLDPKIKDQINASRIIVFDSIAPSSQMKKFVNTINENVPVSSGSAGKIQPLAK